VVALAGHGAAPRRAKGEAMDRPRIVWTAPEPAAAARLGRMAAALAEPPAAVAPVDLMQARLAAALLDVGIPSVAGALTPKEDATGLLMLGAEVEHALMAQYLYACESVSGATRTSILHVAVQEMGHLLTVQNLLLALHGVTPEGLRAEVHLARDGIRRASPRNPLPFVLEPVSHGALAKFVVVERPHQIPDDALRTRVEALEAEVAVAGVHPNPVYALYAAIRWIFQADDTTDAAGLSIALGFKPGWHLGDADFVAPAVVDPLAAEPTEWGSFAGLIVQPVRDRAEALKGLDEIAAQGEGLPGGGADSHFQVFLKVLDKFDAGGLNVTPLPRTPFEPGQPGPEDPQPTPITHPYTALWAQLFNVSYELLLVDIAWAISSPRGGDRRQPLVDMCLATMGAVIQPLAKYLTKRPLNETDALKAGPTFGLADEAMPRTVAEFRARYEALVARSAALAAAIRAHADFPSDTSGGQRLDGVSQIDALREPHKPRIQMSYAIYPPIGFARLGNSPDGFFIGPEGPDSLGLEFDAAGAEQPVIRFKDNDLRMKRQGARFRIFEFSETSDPVEATFPAGTVVRWTVTMANKKDAIVRPGSPSPTPIAVQPDPARADRLISATGTVAGPMAAPASLVGSYRATDVKLGDIRTDGAQRLIVLGGSGRAGSLSNPPAPMGGSFYNNPDWFDDVGDGPVRAVIEIPGEPPQTATGAWVVVGPPDFSPPSLGVVTLHDVVRQMAMDEGWLPPLDETFFETHVRPMIERTSKLRFVDESSAWPKISQDWAALGDPGDAGRPLREATAELVREVENALHDFELREWQNTALDAWVEGTFQPGSAPDRGQCDVLTRAALDGTLGQGFFPGIEAGINMTNPDAYGSVSFEYRFADEGLQAGDVTALMAQPWQADFLKCASGWWPAQRPFRVPQAGGSRRPWLRPTMNHVELVQGVMKLGVVSPDAAGAVIEQDRDPALGA